MTTFRIIPRSEWGARYARGFGPAPLPASEVWLHHSVTIAPDLVPPFDDDHAAVRLLEEIGQSRFGGGISYTFAITPAGLIFEGHGVDREGAHTKGRNSRARAIVLIGNYESAEPTDEQLAAVAWLLQHGHAVGWWKHARLDGGHRDAPGAETACPGRHAEAAIPAVNQLAAGGPVTDNHEEDDPMFQTIELPPTDGQPNEMTIALPWQGGEGGVNQVSAMLCAGAGGMDVHVAHWQRQQGKERVPASPVEPIALVPDGTSLVPRGRTAGIKAAPGVHSLIINYVAPYGGSVVIEGAR